MNSGSGGATGGAAGAGTGAFGDLAMAMPAFRAGQMPVSRTKMQETVLDISASVDNAMVLTFAERKLVDMLQFTAETTAAGDE
ncbi:hypothetical protein BGZ95_007220 [Linnemannia exigua]|uniref:Uncharacterized protein n=1 Tax=Linnemannia exigua TaxID=604196 RepID=A0AAD4DFN3_9FUNG|nr:hypothetical protein BGZ95_007220 [Linnemannia exigua]